MTRNASVLAVAALLASVGTAQIAHAQIGDACQDLGAIGRPYACSAVIVAGGIVGQPGSFGTSVPAPILDRFENHTGGVAEMYGSGTTGTGHAVASGTFGRFGAKVDAQLLFADALPRADVGAHTKTRLIDEMTIVGPNAGAAKGTLTVKAGGSFTTRGGGATLSVKITSLSGLNWTPEYSEYLFYAGRPSVEKTYPLPALSVGQTFYLDSTLWVDAAVSNEMGGVKTGAADMTDGVELTFQFEDPQISLNALSGHDYVTSGAPGTPDSGVPDADVPDAASDAAAGDAGDAGSSPPRKKDDSGGGCAVAGAPRGCSDPGAGAIAALALGALALRRSRSR